MNGGEIILNRIKTDCDEAVKAIRLEADKSRDAVMAEADREAQSRVKVIVEKNEQKLRQTKAASLSRCELEIRNALLRQRRSEIDKTVGALLDYFLGLPDGDYFQDTHVFRVSRRIGLSEGTTVEAVERDLTEGFAPELRPKAHHWLILHGRYTCTARKPKCDSCGLQDICQEYITSHLKV